MTELSHLRLEKKMGAIWTIPMMSLRMTTTIMEVCYFFALTNCVFLFHKRNKTFLFYNILGDAKMNALKALAAVAFITCFFSLGSFIFSFFETWSFVDGFYFCFITMTTIGFGDIVPGNFISF